MSLSNHYLKYGRELRDSVAIVFTFPRGIPLAMITMRKSTHGFPFVSHMSMGLRSGRRNSTNIQIDISECGYRSY